MKLKEYLNNTTMELPVVDADNVFNWKELYNETFEFVEDCLIYLGDNREKLTELFTSTLLSMQGDDIELEDYLKQYYWFIQQLINIAEMKNQRESKVKQQNIKHLIDLIDFNGFGYWGDVDQLTGGDVTKYEQVMNTKWIVCHTKLLWDSKKNDLEFLFQDEQMKKRNKK